MLRDAFAMLSIRTVERVSNLQMSIRLLFHEPIPHEFYTCVGISLPVIQALNHRI